MTEEAGPQPAAQKTGHLGDWISPLLSQAPLWITAFVLVCRPATSANPYEFEGAVLYGMLLLSALFFWVCDGVLRGSLRWRGGTESLLFALFLVAAAVSCARSEYWFAGAKVILIFATYGLTAFLVMQLADSGPKQRFLLSCVAATMVMLAAYALLHLLVFLPALRRWVEAEPAYWRAQLGVQDGFSDLLARVRGDRAWGHFLTSNQLASYVLVAFFLFCGLAVGLWRHVRPLNADAGIGRLRQHTGVLAAGGVAAFILLVLYASGSKGGFVSLVFGVGVFVLLSASGWVRRNLVNLAGLALAGAAVFVVAQFLGIAPPWSRFAASMGVRLGYWDVSLQMAGQHPFFGVGPGCWEWYYAWLKSAGHEETRMAHSAFVQLLAENGLVGLGLFVLYWAVLLWKSVRGALALRPQPSEEPAEPASQEDAWLGPAGLTIGAVALVMDYCFVGTFRQEKYSPMIIQIGPWIVYAAMYLVWAAVFHLLQRGRGAKGSPLVPAWRMVLVGVLAGLGAFLLHSTAEITFRVPALGATAFALAALVLVSTGRLRTHQSRMKGAAGAVLTLAAIIPALLWATLVSPKVMDFASAQDEAFDLCGDLASKDPRVRWSAVEGMFTAYQTATLKIPWDDKSWQDVALNGEVLSSGASDPAMRARLLEQSLAAARRAKEVNPLKAGNWHTLAELLARAGRIAEAAECMRQAADLNQSVPRSWLEYGNVAERAGMTEEACRAYQKALSLDGDEQYHKRNVLKPAERAFVVDGLKACEERGIRQPQPAPLSDEGIE